MRAGGVPRDLHVIFAHISDVMEFMGDQLEVGQRVTFELRARPKERKDESRKRENIVNVRL